MGRIDKWLGKWASRKLLVLFLAITISFFDKLNDNLAMIMMAYIFAQGLVDVKDFLILYKK